MTDPLATPHQSTAPSPKTIQLSFPLPHTHNTTVHLHLTIASHHLLLHLTTKNPESGTGPPPLGSFVYALPLTATTKQPISTPLYLRENTLETATRIAKILTKKTKRPVYVGNSMSFAGAGMGGVVEEEVEGVRRVVEVVVWEVERAEQGEVGGVGGVTQG